VQRRRALEDEPRVHAMIHHGMKLEEYRAFLHDRRIPQRALCAVRAHHGGGFKFLTSHATMDVDHMASLNQLLKTIADPTAQRSIINSTRMNFYLFAQMFRENGFVTHIAG
jgi:hypothetical protein